MTAATRRIHEFLSRGDRLLGIAVIVSYQEFDRLAEHATRWH